MAIRVKRKRSGEPSVSPDASRRVKMEVVPRTDSKLALGLDSKVLEKDDLLLMTMTEIKKIAEVGKSIEAHGTVRIANGTVIIAKESIVNFVKKIRQDVNDQKIDVIDGAKVVSQLGNTIARLANVFRAQNDTSPHKVARKRSSFTPGTAVAMNQTNIHIHKDESSGKT